MNINKNFEKIINPTEEFLTFDVILKNKEYTKIVYDKIFAEIVLFIKKINKVTLQSCNIRNQPNTNKYVGKINCETKKNQYIIIVTFSSKTVEITINGKSIGISSIYGACINKDTLVVSDIKIDIATHKQSLSEKIL